VNLPVLESILTVKVVSSSVQDSEISLLLLFESSSGSSSELSSESSSGLSELPELSELFELLFGLFGSAGELLELRIRKTIPPTTKRAMTGMRILSKLFGFFSGAVGAVGCDSGEKTFVVGTLGSAAEDIASVCRPGMAVVGAVVSVCASGVAAVGVAGSACASGAAAAGAGSTVDAVSG